MTGSSQNLEMNMEFSCSIYLTKKLKDSMRSEAAVETLFLIIKYLTLRTLVLFHVIKPPYQRVLEQ